MGKSAAIALSWYLAVILYFVAFGRKSAIHIFFHGNLKKSATVLIFGFLFYIGSMAKLGLVS